MIFFLFALAIVVSQRYLKKSKRSLTRVSLSKKKRRSPPCEIKKRKVVPRASLKDKTKKKFGPIYAASAARARKFSHVAKEHFFFNSSGIYPQKAVNASTESPPFSRFSWCSQFYLSLCVCARDSLFCCFCRRLSSRSAAERERERER